MRRAALALLAAAAGLALAAALPASAEPLVLQKSMKDVVKPQTELILNILIDALTEPPAPKIDPARIDAGEWEIMETAAVALRDELARLRDADKIQVVADAADHLYEDDAFPGAPKAPEVQARVDAGMESFGKHAEEVRLVADEWLGAIRARDAEKTWKTALAIDCVECHEIFWSGEPEGEHDHEPH